MKTQKQFNKKLVFKSSSVTELKTTEMNKIEGGTNTIALPSSIIVITILLK